MNATIQHLAPSEPISVSTVEQYQRVAKRLVARASVAGGILSGSLPFPQVVDFLESLMPTIRPRTFRFYKASLAYHLKTLGGAGEALKALASLEKLSSKDVEKVVMGRRTSSQKSKHLSADEMSAIKKALNATNTNKARRTLVWLEASVFTGLRPREWCGAELILNNGVKILKVRNLKTTQGRSLGESRSIELSDLPEEGIQVIKTHLRLFRQRCLAQGNGRVNRNVTDSDEMHKQKCIDAAYDQVYTECRQLLYRTVRKLFKRRKLHVTLYTGRHQFAADAKLTYDKATVAALLGHRSLETAGKFYGLSARGSALKVKPSIDTRQAVISRNATKGMSADIVYRPVIPNKNPQLPKSKPI